MSVVYKRKHRVVVSGVLVCLVVSHDHALDLFHIVYFKHLQRALVNNVLKAWFVGAGVIPVVWEKQFAVNHFSVVVALLERCRRVICAY